MYTNISTEFNAKPPGKEKKELKVAGGEKSLERKSRNINDKTHLSKVRKRSLLRKSIDGKPKKINVDKTPFSSASLVKQLVVYSAEEKRELC